MTWLNTKNLRVLWSQTLVLVSVVTSAWSRIIPIDDVITTLPPITPSTGESCTYNGVIYNHSMKISGSFITCQGVYCWEGSVMDLTDQCYSTFLFSECAYTMTLSECCPPCHVQVVPEEPVISPPVDTSNCLYDGVLLGHGDVLLQTPGSCSGKVCLAGAIHDWTTDCSHLPVCNGTIVQTAGMCCPVCDNYDPAVTGPSDSLLTPIMSPGTLPPLLPCVYQGREYLGSIKISGSYDECYGVFCFDGVITELTHECYKNISLLSCTGFVSILDCCPVCYDDTTYEPLVPPPTAPPCLYFDVLYPNGSVHYTTPDQCYGLQCIDEVMIPWSDECLNEEEQRCDGAKLEFYIPNVPVRCCPWTLWKCGNSTTTSTPPTSSTLSTTPMSSTLSTPSTSSTLSTTSTLSRLLTPPTSSIFSTTSKSSTLSTTSTASTPSETMSTSPTSTTEEVTSVSPRNECIYNGRLLKDGDVVTETPDGCFGTQCVGGTLLAWSEKCETIEECGYIVFEVPLACCPVCLTTRKPISTVSTPNTAIISTPSTTTNTPSTTTSTITRTPSTATSTTTSTPSTTTNTPSASSTPSTTTITTTSTPSTTTSTTTGTPSTAKNTSCVYDGMVFQNGQVISESPDHCSRQWCSNGEVMRWREMCAQPVCLGQLETLPNACCPVCRTTTTRRMTPGSSRLTRLTARTPRATKTPTTATPSSKNTSKPLTPTRLPPTSPPLHKSCIVNERWYNHGENISVPLDPCTYTYCNNGEVERWQDPCRLQTMTATCNGRLQKVPGSCCPVCVPLTSPMTTTRTTVSPSLRPNGCLVEGKWFGEGETIWTSNDQCRGLVCRGGQRVPWEEDCVKRQPVCNGRLETLDGQCCPVCRTESSTPSALASRGQNVRTWVLTCILATLMVAYM